MSNKNKRNKPSKATVITGVVLILLTPLVYIGISLLTMSSCPQLESGACELGYSLKATQSVLIATVLWATIALTVLIFGIVKAIRE